MKLRIGLFALIMGIALLIVFFVLPSDKWKDTPQEALADEAEFSTIDEDGILEIDQLLDIFYFKDTAEMLYVSEADTLVACTFWRNDNEQFCVAGYSSEDPLDDPHYFVISDDPDQWIGQPYTCLNDEGIVYGYKYSSVQLFVNDVPVYTKTYTFSLGGKEWSIDYWWAENVEFDKNGDCSVTMDTDPQE